MTPLNNGLWANVLSTTVETGDSILFVSTSGGIVNPGMPGNYVNVLVRVLVDGVVQETRSYEVELVTAAVSTNWSFAFTTDVGAGSHTVLVQAQRQSAIPLNLSAQVGGVDNSPFRGTLSVLVVNQ